MTSRITKFNIDTNIIEKLVTKLSKSADIKKIDIDIKQFVIDVVMGNYKIDKKNAGVLLGSMAILIMPTEMITSVVFGRIAFLIDTALGAFDEAFFTAKIIVIIIDEAKSYSKFVEKDDYTPAKIKAGISLNFNAEQIIEQVKASVDGMKTDENEATKNELAIFENSLSITDIVQYSTNDYKDVAINYLVNNQKGSKDNFVKLDSNKIKRKIVIRDAFNEVEFQKVVQSQMKQELESNPKKLGTYRLTGIEESTRSAIQSLYETAEFGTTRIYKLLGNKLSIELLNYIVAEINQLDNQIENVVFITDKLLIEVSVIDNYNVQVISNDANYVRITEELIDELSIQLKSNKSLISSKMIGSNPGFVVTDQLIEYQVRVALEKVYALMSDQVTVELSHDNFLRFIPMFKKEDRVKYLICAQNEFDSTTVSESKVIIQVQQDYDFKAELNDFSINQKNNYLLLSTKIDGNLDVEHVIKVMHKLFLIQLYSTDSDLIKLVVNIDCSNGVLLQAKEYGKYEVSVIDATAKLGNNTELQVEAILKAEIKTNMKLFKTYNK